MTDSKALRRSLEAILTVALEPVDAAALADVLGETTENVREQLEAVAVSLVNEDRGFRVVELASGWRMQSSPDAIDAVQRFASRDVSTRLSTAALETLAIVAYRQPVSRAQIATLRGVNVDGVVRLLEQRGYIQEVGRADGPGQPVLFGTTEMFLDRLGLSSLEQLPRPEELLPSDEDALSLASEISTPCPRSRTSSACRRSWLELATVVAGSVKT